MREKSKKEKMKKKNDYRKSESPLVNPYLIGVYFNEDDEYFGHCLNENHDNFNVNVGKENWFYCPICKIKWLAGWGLLSDPPESEVGDLRTYWLKNKLMLEKYEEVDKIKHNQ
jgi:hypothetical protein